MEEVNSNKDKNEYPSKDVILEEVRERRRVEFTRIDALDTKAGIYIVASLVFFELIIQKVNFENRTLNVETFFALLSFSSVLFTLYFSFWAILGRRYRVDPKIEPLIDQYLHKPPEKTKEQLIANYQDSLKENFLTIKKKALFTQRALESLIYTIIFYLAPLTKEIWEIWVFIVVGIIFGYRRNEERKEVKKNG